MDAPGHLLSLKVMRISRPSLASSWQPFFTSSPSFSAHATNSLLSLQGKDPLPGHPKTLRDLTHASELLTLPSSFGAIQLGETFTSCLCVNNEASVEIENVTLRIEMQTATSKTVLAEVGGSEQKLQATDVLEAIASHEMKELGQHVLACYVSYRLPPSFRIPPRPAGDPTDPSLQAFRKYYKFSVTNPLNVKTKVHVPRSPAALLSRSEREKIFLEIHVQNLTQEPLWFERIHFENVEGWYVEDGNILQKDGDSLFSGPAAIMQPQDIRQYVYILTPTFIPPFPVTHAPGTIIPLGRLDLTWRSSFGEPGRLLTSLLTRRIPIPLAQAAASALPFHLQRAGTPVRGGVRAQSPLQTFSRPSTPPLASPAPFKPRPPSQHIVRPQSPAAVVPPSPGPPSNPDLDVDLVVRSIPLSDIRLERPFEVTFELTLSGLLPPPAKTRLVHLVVQHLQPPRMPSQALVAGSTTNLPFTPSPRSSVEILSPRSRQNHTHLRDPEPPDSASPTMSPVKSGVLNFGLGLGQVHADFHLIHQVTEADRSTIGDSADPTSQRSSTVVSSHTTLIRLPPPVLSSKVSGGVLPLGNSVLSLPPFALTRPSPATSILEKSGPNAQVNSRKGEVAQQFECTFVPVRKGFATVGGLRILLLEDREIVGANGAQMEELGLIPHSNADAKILREWNVVGEVWVAS